VKLRQPRVTGHKMIKGKLRGEQVVKEKKKEKRLTEGKEKNRQDRWGRKLIDFIKNKKRGEDTEGGHGSIQRDNSQIERLECITADEKMISKPEHG